MTNLKGPAFFLGLSRKFLMKTWYIFLWLNAKKVKVKYRLKHLKLYIFFQSFMYCRPKWQLFSEKFKKLVGYTLDGSYCKQLLREQTITFYILNCLSVAVRRRYNSNLGVWGGGDRRKFYVGASQRGHWPQLATWQVSNPGFPGNKETTFKG